MFGRVERAEWISQSMVRVVLGGKGLDDFTPSSCSDSYLNASFPTDGAPYTVPFDVDVERALPAEQRPASRRYTVREWDPDRRLLTIDFVVHGDTDVAGPWASSAQPGDLLQLSGPSGAYAPDPEADWHLMVGDESALPAIAASLARVPAGVLVHVLVEVDGPVDELALTSPGELHLSWLHREANPGADDLALRALEKLNRPDGRVHAFVHGEAVGNRTLRRHLLVDWQLPQEDLSVSPYWRRTYTDERWREIKRSWLAEVERDA